MSEGNEQIDAEANMETERTSDDMAVYMVQTEEKCPVKFSIEEFIEISKKVTDAHGNIERVESHKKSLQESYKRQITSLKETLSEAVATLSRGYHMKPISCTIKLDFPVYGQKICTRDDTGEQVWVKEMANEDRQMRLSLEGETQYVENIKDDDGKSDGETKIQQEEHLDEMQTDITSELMTKLASEGEAFIQKEKKKRNKE